MLLPYQSGSGEHLDKRTQCVRACSRKRKQIQVIGMGNTTAGTDQGEVPKPKHKLLPYEAEVVSWATGGRGFLFSVLPPWTRKEHAEFRENSNRDTEEKYEELDVRLEGSI